MFTGLIEATGELAARDRRGPGYRVLISCRFGDLEIGESIAVSGTCLTVVAFDERSFAADVSLETAEKTTLGRVELGSALNLERSLRVGDRLGGHWVSGHVDGVARVLRVENVGEAWRVAVAPPAELMRFVAPKGSVALDGVSLTVNEVDQKSFEVMLIPHTREVTNFSKLAPGVELNMEVDLLARYVVRQLELLGSTDAPSPDARILDLLAHGGFMKDRKDA